MLPEVGSVVAFLLLVAPGVVFELVRERRRPARDDSAFLEASRVLLAGVATAAGALTVLGLGRLAGNTVLTPPGPVIADTRAYVSAHPGSAFFTAAMYLVVASTFAVIAADARSHHGHALEITSDSAWVISLSTFKPKGTNTHVSVTLRDGTTYVGRSIVFTSDSKHTDRE